MNNDIKAQELPIACILSNRDRLERQTTIAKELFTNFQQFRELNDGYAFSYPGNYHWTSKLTEFITLERNCCRFFTFELEFEPNEGPIWFRMRGPEEVKVFLKNFTNYFSRATNETSSLDLSPSCNIK
jgi:hypothetical protein